MHSSLLAALDFEARNAIRLAGLMLPMILFADDIVLLSRECGVLQRLLDTLARFCRENGLTVSTSKTKWLVGGALQPDAVVGNLLYSGVALERVPRFKYLGLEFDGSGGVHCMREARLLAARRSWCVLQS